MDIKPYVSIIWKWGWLIVLATGLAAGLTYRSASRVPRVYEATTTLLVGRSLQTQNPNPDDFQTSQTLAKSYAQLVRSQSILQATSDALKLNVPWYALSPEVSATAVEGTELITISVIDANPRRAQVIADELARQLILESPTPKPNDPQRQFANEQMTKLQGQINTIQGQIADLQKKADQETSATALQDERNQITVLQQRVDGWQNTYAKLSDFYQGSRVNYLSVVNPATLPTSPVGTSIKYEVALAGGLGFALALAGIVVIEFFDDTIKTRQDVAAALELPLLGGIGRVWRMRNSADHLFAQNASRSFAAEACRFLAANVLFANSGDSRSGVATSDQPSLPLLISGPQAGVTTSPVMTSAALPITLLVTSPGPAEGKSTVASNLAIALAKAGKRVVLVDGNLRRPSLHRLFGLANRDGLSTMLDDDAVAIASVLKETAIPNLRVLPSGPLPTNPGEVLVSDAMKARLAQLRSIADVVVFDSPAILGAADATALGAICDAAILVVRAGRTRRPVAAQAKATFRQVGVEIQGVILNGYETGRKNYQRYYAISATDAAPGRQVHCPYLGLRTDPSSILLGPTAEHRCHVTRRPKKIEAKHQATFCLTGGYPACARLAQVGARQTTLPSKQPGNAKASELDHS